MEDGFYQSPKTTSIQRKSKKCFAHISPEKLTFSGNFTLDHRLFDIQGTGKRASMRRDILNTVIKRTESKLLEGTDEVPCKLVDENPLYEDPRDVIAAEKPPKPPRKRNIQAVAITSPRPSRESKSLLREQKRKLSKKYEGLITTLISRCEESVVTISEKDAYILKLKDKLKAVLEYNKLFADENDQLKTQYSTLVQYVEECKTALKGERERNSELEARCKELGDRVKQLDVPDKDRVETAIPLVEVCMSCSSRQILLTQAREHSHRMQRDMQALKDVLYRLNVQLSRYQEKLRTNIQNLATDNKADKFDLDSLITTSLGYRGPEVGNTDDAQSKSGTEDQPQTCRVVDLSGLLSAQALAPLFDAYQENLQEKDTLILDYEKQFENINKKSKQIVSKNKSLLEKVTALESELAQVRQSYKKLGVEKETGDIERATLLERAERAESKLKEVYELYEDKMAAMMRDYETVHREYFTLKHALEASDSKMAALDALRARTVPADLHERRLEHCKRLLEELKHQYGMENERKTEQVAKLQQQLRAAEERCSNAEKDLLTAKEELTAALKNVRLYRKAAVIFRHRMRSAAARAIKAKRSVSSQHAEPLRRALDTLERIKREIKEVKSRAHSSLEELERRIVEQERRASSAQLEYRRELERANLALEHKEGIIRSLIDKVADVEEVRLSQTNAHRLQGIVSDSSSERTASDRPDRTGVKLVPGPGGYFQEDRGKKKGKG
ncbi:protein Cep89 homolog isoform X2 [Cydia amplana]|uniref:protein Cep89 homolog isoform X1 n=1 Tax=Cydia amplana TaxID=1869771 RepID=UPI002FE53909